MLRNGSETKQNRGLEMRQFGWRWVVYVQGYTRTCDKVKGACSDWCRCWNMYCLEDINENVTSYGNH